MSGLDTLSRWVMYFGVFAFLGTLMQELVLSATLGLVLVLQYPALTFYRGYTEAGNETETGAGDL